MLPFLGLDFRAHSRLYFQVNDGNVSVGLRVEVFDVLDGSAISETSAWVNSGNLSKVQEVVPKLIAALD